MRPAAPLSTAVQRRAGRFILLHDGKGQDVAIEGEGAVQVADGDPDGGRSERDAGDHQHHGGRCADAKPSVTRP
jgi:hypothetical protein